MNVIQLQGGDLPAGRVVCFLVASSAGGIANVSVATAEGFAVDVKCLGAVDGGTIYCFVAPVQPGLLDVVVHLQNGESDAQTRRVR